ncbi:hypothetical protein CYLTODRAFT_453219 [Cylindrobasidium torrendii FP15055 ss-10]|uniref:Uncharacterized protein n=1 Tax=Cylindrobasidium torrendii FP15055 ss-10 TaxID=1314674 RepID=A0A0D7BDZ8_9AGAR|nr:hypothetical protein CYLTODRAFT_453219 [Cylindrobasidium torrendii FP15055 ss-10]
MKASPVCIFSLACAFKLYDIARDAARQALHIPMEEWPFTSHDLEAMPSGAYHDLVQYYLRCGNAAYTAANIHLSTSGECAGCKTSLNVDRGGLALGSMFIHIRSDHAARHQYLVDFGCMLGVREMYRRQPTGSGVPFPRDVFDVILKKMVPLCRDQDYKWAVSHARLSNAIENMQKEIDQAVDEVSFSLTTIG